MDSRKNLIIVLGPTSVGKSATSIKIATAFRGEIINCDSMQVYKGFDVGTDKVTPEKRENIPHYLLDVVVEKQTQEKLTGGAMELSEEQQLRREIRRHPEEVTNHINLSDYFFRLEDFEAAEQVMAEAVEVTGAIRATEELEDIQLHRAQIELMRAKKRAKETQKREDADLYRRMKEELNKRELAVFAARSERYPGDLKMKFELGLRLKRAGNYEQAVREFQQARNDSDRAAQASLETGECFQQIRQTRLALDAYETAIKNCKSSADLETKKLSLYRAGWLSMKLQDNNRAEKFLSELAGIDFGFRDVAALLDKVSKNVDRDVAES